MRLAATNVAGDDVRGSRGVTLVLHLHDRAVETDPRRLFRSIERRVVDVGRTDVLHRGSWDGAGNQPANEQARNRGIAVWKVNRRTSAGTDLATVMPAGQIGEQPLGTRLE